MAYEDYFEDSFSNQKKWPEFPSKGSQKSFTVSCFESHKPLKVGDYEIHGGSCLRPTIKDADVYIGFDHGMNITDKSWPWAKKAEEVYFHIPDMQAPASAEDFDNLLEWVVLQLIAGKKVHAGCIGGHGRTGTFLAALVTKMTGNKDSITYVREHYCKKAVESKVQVEFLHKNYGITQVAGAKVYASGSKTYTGAKTSAMPNVGDYKSSSDKLKIASKPQGVRRIDAVKSSIALW